MEIISKSVNDTINIGKRIAKNLKPADIICLFGELGSGKTILAKGIALGLGIKGISVSSPSFILMRKHLGKFPFYHFDLYRLKTPQDILKLGYEEYLYNEAISVIEWADRLKYLMPDEFLKIELSIIKVNSQRLLKFTARGRRYKELLEKIHEDIRD